MPRRGPSRILLCCAVASCIVIVFRYFPCHWGPTSTMVPRNPIKYMHDKQNRAYPYHKDMPIIFIGGVPRSGTTLMRAILDAHPDVRCGEETRVIPRILGLRASWQRSKREALRLIEAGVTDEVLDSAVASFILEIMAKHGEPAPRLCNKDPFTLKSSMYLGSLFPNSKYILMVRDGRATVQSIINRRVTISGFDHKNYRHCLFKWNEAMETMYYQCIRLGIHRCLPVRYEELVLHPENLLRFILDFLGLEWDDAVLHHQDFINKPGGISLSKTERSTDQVIKPLNLEALTRWVKDIPENVKKDIDKIAPMLERLGYDPHAFPPNYGEADSLVIGNTNKIRQNPHVWEEKFKKLWQASTKAVVNATATTHEPVPVR